MLRERTWAMSPEQASVVIPAFLFGYIFLVTCANIFLAKKRTREWESLTAFFFFAGMGGIIFQIEKRAEKLWIKTLGYDRADAILLSKYQSFALVELILGCPTLLLLLGNSVNRQ
jgi:hypothetical protein